jgi:hypothetical protein
VGSGFLAATARELCRHLAHQFVVEPAADAADVKPAMFGVGFGQQQRAEAGAAALGRGVADDREFVAGQLFGLAPVIPTAAAIGTVGTLGDDALEVALARQLVRGLAITFDVRAEGQVRRRVGQQLLQQRLAFEKRRIGNVHAVDVQQVEQRESQLALAFA